MTKEELLEIQDILGNGVQVLQSISNSLSLWSAKFELSENLAASNDLKKFSRELQKWSLRFEQLNQKLLLWKDKK